MRIRGAEVDDGARIMLSPLVDCVLVLLIFLLAVAFATRGEGRTGIDAAGPLSAVAPQIPRLGSPPNG